MKKLFIFFLFLMPGTFVEAQINNCLKVPQMDYRIQNIISNCGAMQRVGDLPNGDAVFIVWGLPLFQGLDSFQIENASWEQVVLSQFRGGEALLLHSPRFGWDVLIFSENPDFIMIDPYLNEYSWDVEVVFQNRETEEQVSGAYSFLQNRFIFPSKESEEKIYPAAGP